MYVKERKNMKEELKENTHKDLDIARGAMREIIEHNRKINNNLVEQMEESDFSLLEEYSMITKGILDAAKLLSEINAQTPKTIKDIDSVQEGKKEINLGDLIE